MKDELEDLLSELEATRLRGRFNPAGIFSVPEGAPCLDTAQLAELEKTFRAWAEDPKRTDVRFSRQRILLIFLLIRYTGARLNEVLSLDDQTALDLDRQMVTLGKTRENEEGGTREVQIPADLAEEIRKTFNDPQAAPLRGSFFQIDPAHVRRKFYERAESCGFSREDGNPNALRRSRAVELLRSNLPLPVVQRVLGHSTPSLAASYVQFSPEDVQQLTRRVVDREQRRRTSARNSFFGKITRIQKGDIQNWVEFMTLGGFSIVALITTVSLQSLNLRIGSFVTAEVKSPWVILERLGEESRTSAENRLEGTISQIIKGSVTAEIIVTLPDGTNVCSLVTEESRRRLELAQDDPVRVIFNANSVILNID